MTTPGPSQRDPRSAWRGERIRLRAFETGDVATYAAWDDDAKQSRALYRIPFPRSPEAYQRWAEQEATRQPDGDNRRFVIEDETGEVIGDLTTHHGDPRAGTLEYGISVRHGCPGKGYGEEAIRLVLRHYFGELGYQKVTVGIAAFNEASVRLHERLGFQLEGRLRRVVYTGGQHHDLLMYGLTAEEFAATGG